MASSQIPLPEILYPKKPEERKRWIERFECPSVSGLDEKYEKVQIKTLVYAMGRNANDVLKILHIAERDFMYATVKRLFDTHFVGRSNSMIVERARFKERVQGEKESVVEFTESLNELAETSQFRPLKEELIRDPIVSVVGICNSILSQKLM